MKNKRRTVPWTAPLLAALVFCSCLLRSTDEQLSYYIAVFSPKNDTAALAGEYFYVQWLSSAEQFPRVAISLYNDDTRISTIADTLNKGIFLWKIPPSVSSGSNYSIRVSGIGESVLTGVSAPFRIVNKNDTYEPDDTISLAKEISTDGTLQTHTLSHRTDVDWYRFPVGAEKSYLIRMENGENTAITFPKTGKMYTRMPDDDRTPTIVSFTVDTTCYFRISSRASGNEPFTDTVPYILSIECVDSLVQMVSPQGGESFTAGAEIPLRWIYTRNALPIAFKLLRGDAVVCTLTTGDFDYYTWDLPIGLAGSDDYNIMVYSTAAPEVFSRSEVFTVSPAQYSLAVTSPTKGAVWQTGEHAVITWKSDSLSENLYCRYLSVVLYGDTGIVSTICSDVYTSAGGADWTIPWDLPPSAKYRVGIRCGRDSSVNSMSEEFSIVQRLSTFQVISPVKDCSFENGDTLRVGWVLSGPPVSRFTIDLCDSADRVIRIADSSYGYNNSYQWLIPSTIPSGRYRVGISAAGDSTVNGMSEFFSITRVDAGFTILSPAAGSSITGRCTVSWKTIGPAGSQVAIALWSDSMLLQGINSGVKFSGDSGTYGFEIPYTVPQGDRYRIQLKARDDSLIQALSGFFTIIPELKTITVTMLPQDSVITAGGMARALWTSTGIADAFVPKKVFRVDLCDSARFVVNLFSGLGYTVGACTWDVPAGLPVKSTYRIKVSSMVYPDVFGFGPFFTIRGN